MALSLITAPTVEPLTVAEAAAHVKCDDATDDAYLSALITVARETVEAETNRALITQTWDWKFDGWPCFPIEVPKGPLISVTHLKYLDTDGTEQTWAATNYRVSAYAGPRCEPGRIALAYQVTLPSARDITDAVTIRFVAGYGASSSYVPQPLRQAMKLLIGELYARREDAVQGTIIATVPRGVQSLLTNYRLHRVG